MASNNMHSGGQQNAPFGAHEIIGMNEALMTKAANVELLSTLSQQVQDGELRNMLQNQAQTALRHYNEGVQLLRSQSNQNPSWDGGSYATGSTFNSQGFGSGVADLSSMNASPQLGLRQPSMPAPSMNAQNLSERTVCTVVLNLHKHGAVAWMQLALECASVDLRQYLVSGALACDAAAFETWSFMNHKGYYQVPTLMNKTTQTMIDAFQTAGTNSGMHMQSYQ